MKKQYLALLMIILSVVLVGCDGLKTPESLIQPPELNLEKKKLNDALLSFLPPNSELIVLPVSGNTRQESSVINKNIDSDQELEAVALYRERSSRKLGMIVLDQRNDVWYKKSDIKLDAYEIADYEVIDLDGDGIDEILIGYYGITNPNKVLNIYEQTDTLVKLVYKTNYLALEVLDVDEDGLQEIAISELGSGGEDNKVSIQNFIDGKVELISQLTYPNENEVYSISYGKVNENISGYFVDMYVNQAYGQTDVLIYENRNLKSIIENSEIGDIIQAIPIKSVDIDEDGFIEIAKIPLEDELFTQGNTINSYLKRYYKIKETLELELSAEVYEDIEFNVSIAFPKSYWDKYIISRNVVDGKLIISYRSPITMNVIPILEIIKVDKNQIEEYLEEYNLILDLETFGILGKLETNFEGLNTQDSINIENMIADSSDLSVLVKPSNL